jgi:hypothetical protein
MLLLVPLHARCQGHIHQSQFHSQLRASMHFYGRCFQRHHRRECRSRNSRVSHSVCCGRLHICFGALYTHFYRSCGFNLMMKRHCYYIGLEANQNSILYNIGSRTNEMITWGEQLAGHSDHDRATFFIRSSENTYIGNVAAGSAGRG